MFFYFQSNTLSTPKLKRLLNLFCPTQFQMCSWQKLLGLIFVAFNFSAVISWTSYIENLVSQCSIFLIFIFLNLFKLNMVYSLDVIWVFHSPWVNSPDWWLHISFQATVSIHPWKLEFYPERYRNPRWLLWQFS